MTDRPVDGRTSDDNHDRQRADLKLRLQLSGRPPKIIDSWRAFVWWRPLSNVFVNRLSYRVQTSRVFTREMLRAYLASFARSIIFVLTIVEASVRSRPSVCPYVTLCSPIKTVQAKVTKYSLWVATIIFVTKFRAAGSNESIKTGYDTSLKK